MAALYVQISPVILDWLIKKAEVSDNTSVYNLLTAWRNEKKKPTFNQIEKLSKKMQIPFGYFFLKELPVETHPLTEFRTITSQGIHEELSTNLRDTIDAMMNIQDWMRDYVKDMGQNEKTYVGSCSIEMGMQAIAKQIRKDLRLLENWMVTQKDKQESFKFLRYACQEAGILVMMNGIVGSNTHRPLDIQEFRAFTLVDKYVPLIFINAKDSISGRIFSLLHEIVHIWMGINSIYNESTEQFGQAIGRIEQICNAVASELLVPIHLFAAAWEKNTEPLVEKINSLSKNFTCSPVVIARKALDMHYIKKDTYREIVAIAIKKYKETQKKKENGGDYYATMNSRLDPRFIYAVEASAKSGRTPYSDVYRMTNTNRTTFKKLRQKIIEGAGGMNS